MLLNRYLMLLNTSNRYCQIVSDASKYVLDTFKSLSATPETKQEGPALERIAIIQYAGPSI